MVDWVRFLLRLNYLYGRFIGVINFEVDMESGESRLSRQATIYAIAMNTLTFSLVPLLITSRIWTLFLVSADSLHRHVILVMILMRVCCVFITLASRWWQRNKILELLHNYRRLVRQQPQVQRLWRRGVISKCITGTCSEIMYMVVGFCKLRNHLTATIATCAFLTYLLMGWLNLVLAQFFFALLNVRSHYLVMNQELRSIIAETHLLELDRFRESRERKSLKLTDRVLRLALIQARLQQLVVRLTRIFGLQNLCIHLTFKMTMVSSVYYTFCAFKYSIEVDWWSWDTVLITVNFFFYFFDSLLTHSITGYVEFAYRDMTEIMAEHATCAHDVDERLQTAFEYMKLQLARNPHKLPVMGLYNLQRANVIGIVSSLVSLSLILIQYDIKNYNAT